MLKKEIETIDFSGHLSSDACKMNPIHQKKYKKVANGSTHSDNVFVVSDSPITTETMVDGVQTDDHEESINQVREECHQCGHLTNSKATFIP